MKRSVKHEIQSGRSRNSYILYTILILLFATLISAGYYYAYIQEDDSFRINLAGRERMLVQKMTKEVLLFKMGKTSPEQITKTMKMFEDSLHALASGGNAPVDLESTAFKKISGTSDFELVRNLMSIEKEWMPFKKSVSGTISSGNRNSLNYVISRNEILLEKIDRYVYALQLKAEKNNFIIRVIIICSFLFISILLIYNLARRINELRRASEKIKELEKLLPIRSNCKKIRTNDSRPLEPSSWTTIEEYLHKKNDMIFTHSICPVCMEKLYPGLINEMKK